MRSSRFELKGFGKESKCFPHKSPRYRGVGGGGANSTGQCVISVLLTYHFIRMDDKSSPFQILKEPEYPSNTTGVHANLQNASF